MTDRQKDSPLNPDGRCDCWVCRYSDSPHTTSTCPHPKYPHSEESERKDKYRMHLKKMEGQIRYHRWGDATEEHKYYFRDIENIAWVIGSMLMERGMKVVQMKEKFGECRVYTTVEHDITESQKDSYRLVYETVCSLLPHYRDAILSGADYPELLKGLNEA